VTQPPWGSRAREQDDGEGRTRCAQRSLDDACLKPSYPPNLPSASIKKHLIDVGHCLTNDDMVTAEACDGHPLARVRRCGVQMQQLDASGGDGAKKRPGPVDFGWARRRIYERQIKAASISLSSPGKRGFRPRLPPPCKNVAIDGINSRCVQTL